MTAKICFDECISRTTFAVQYTTGGCCMKQCHVAYGVSKTLCQTLCESEITFLRSCEFVMNSSSSRVKLYEPHDRVDIRVKEVIKLLRSLTLSQ